MLIDSADALNSEAKARGGQSWLVLGSCELGLGASSAITLKEERCQELPGERYQAPNGGQVVPNFFYQKGLTCHFAAADFLGWFERSTNRSTATFEDQSHKPTINHQLPSY